MSLKAEIVFPIGTVVITSSYPDFVMEHVKLAEQHPMFLKAFVQISRVIDGETVSRYYGPGEYSAIESPSDGATASYGPTMDGPHAI